MQITVPTDWSDITLSQFQQLVSTEKMKLTDLESSLQRISIITGVPDTELRSLSSAEIEALAKELEWMGTTEPPQEFSTFVNVDGVELALEPNLHQLSVGAWSDIENWLDQGSIENLHQILSVLYRPVLSKSDNGYQIEPYNGEESMKRAELLADECKVAQVYGASLFFSHFASGLMRLTLASS